MYDVTLRHFYGTIIAVKNSKSYILLCVWVCGCGFRCTEAGMYLRACSLTNPACSEPAILPTAAFLAPP